jgi:ELP3 family radical SAM enzyme/protein acetyltransferase
MKNPLIQADQWKIYPTMTTRWTDIKLWYDAGDYLPYAEENNGEKLINLLISVKERMLPWIRLNRIIRDIPEKEIYGGHKKGNLRQDLHEIFTRERRICRCIRCREIKSDGPTYDIDNIVETSVIIIREYEASNGIEYFISCESPDEKILYGFARLRINYVDDMIYFDVLKNCALIRELHVYGCHNNNNNNNIQHHGLGKKLMKCAETIAYNNGINGIAVIAGIGAREYYRKIGYHLKDTYMVKNL